MVIFMREKILYTISRIGILLMANVICPILSITLVSWIASLFITGSGGRIKIKDALFESGGLYSFVAWIIVLFILVILFIDDGVKHSAYESYDSTSISIVLILMFAVYYIPVLFMNRTTGNTQTGFKGFYYPCKWIGEKFSLTYEVSALISIGATLILCLLGYVIAHAIYMKKHPALDWRVKNPNADYSSKDE